MVMKLFKGGEISVELQTGQRLWTGHIPGAAETARTWGMLEHPPGPRIVSTQYLSFPGRGTHNHQIGTAC